MPSPSGSRAQPSWCPSCASAPRTQSACVASPTPPWRTGATPDRGLAGFLVPRSEWEIIDTWHVSGLRGTGSKDIVIDGVFVPEAHMLWRSDLAQATTPGRELHDRASYRIPGYSIEGFCI